MKSLRTILTTKVARDWNLLNLDVAEGQIAAANLEPLVVDNS